MSLGLIFSSLNLDVHFLEHDSIESNDWLFPMEDEASDVFMVEQVSLP